MELNQIEYFLKLYEERSFTKASKALFITQQGLSKSILNLEAELGLPLFNRYVKGVVPTEYGKRLYEHFKKTNSDLKRIYKEVEQIRNASAGELRIACSAGFLSVADLSFLYDFQKRYHDIKINFEEFPEITADEQLKSDYWDIGFLCDPLDKITFNTIPFFEEKVYAYVHKNHPYAQKRSFRLADLDNQDLLFYPESHKKRLAFDELCKQQDFHPNIIFETASPLNMISLLEQNAGIMMCIPSIVSKYASKNIIEIPMEEDYYWSISLAWKKNTTLPFNAQLFLSFMEKHLNKYI